MYKKLFVLFFTFIIFVFLRGPVNSKSSEVVEVSPNFFDLDFSAPSSSSINIQVSNFTNYNVSVILKVYNCNIDQDNPGDITISNDKSDIPPANWVVFDDKSIYINSQTSEEFTFEFIIPENVESKSYYMIISFEVYSDKEDKNDIKTTYELSSLIFMNISNNEISNQIEITRFTTDKRLYAKEDVKFDIELTNTGDFYSKPKGYIEIYDSKDIKRLIEFEINENYNFLLPGQKITATYHWLPENNDPFPNFGNYSSKLIVIENENFSSAQSEYINFLVISNKYFYIFISIIVIVSTGLVYYCKVKTNLRISNHK